ncbi:hypothetical protein BXZ70DRAFT_1004497 [Cristinia sonorae]|uniref:Uncharacterized protein n=1 Tax=Cristinia sonorae TaxID=1940300 RepID=A0A8K0XU18_9AGAR|nr:hypothetical protein BXZ70DRAFT_1004497 [Cristinia sonorae]
MSLPLKLALRTRWRSAASTKHPLLNTRRAQYSTQTPNATGSTRPSPSPHAHFYSDLVPGMVPVALLGSAIYLGLRLFQSSLSHEKYLDEARARIDELEAQIDAIRTQQAQATPEPVSGTTSPELPTSRRWWLW